MLSAGGKPLVKSQRYTFHLANGRDILCGVTTFRANFIEILTNNHGKTLRVDHYGDDVYGMCRYPNSVYTMPLSFVGLVETIEDVTEHKSVLPEEVMLIIDGYTP